MSSIITGQPRSLSSVKGIDCEELNGVYSQSPFVLRYNHKKKVWRRHNERYSPQCTVGTVKHDQKIMVWGCFTGHGVGRLYLVEGILEQNQYIRILEHEMLPSAQNLFGDRYWALQ